MLARLLTLLALSAIAAVPAAQSAFPATQAPRSVARSASLLAPTGVRAFLLRADEPIGSSFPRTPSFAWVPYEGAQSYEFELATSTTFDDRTMVWSTAVPSSLKVPTTAIPIALPWMTGNPYALYARVRAQTAKGATRWSAPFGFNTGPWPAPRQITPDISGLVRWTPVVGATSYEVWFKAPIVGQPDKVIATTTNVADEREYYTLQDPARASIIQWRVRAVRKLYGALPNALPAVSVGPWSEVFVSINPPLSAEPLRPVESVSDTVGTPAAPATHNLTPGFVFTGGTATTFSTDNLYRVYVASDSRCVNIVFTGSVVGSPAYAPRTSGPLLLTVPTPPTTTTTTTTTTTSTSTTTPTTTATTPTPAAPSFAPDGSQNTFGADGRPVFDNEELTSSSSGAPTTSPPGSATPTPSSTIPSDFTTPGPFVDLWDLGRPNARYWWTVVPVIRNGTDFRDAESPQDACAAGRIGEFAKTSQPVVTSSTSPYASGLSAYGELVSARTLKPSFYRAALIGWEPAPGAIGYEVQWSKTRAPWKTASAQPVYTAATSLLLDSLAPGTWFYRVRGIDPYVPGPVKQMTWSTPVQIKVAKPMFIVEKGVTVRPLKK